MLRGIHMNDLDLLLLLGPLVLILAIACEVAWRNRYVPQWLARKVLHIAAVGSCALVPLLLEDLALLRWIVIGSEFILIWLVVSGRLFDQDGSKSWGILLFPVPYLFLLYVESDRWLIALPMAILAFADSFAALAGLFFSHRFFRFTADPKSMTASVAFVLVSILVMVFFPEIRSFLAVVPLWASIAMVGVIALLLTGIEALASRGTDNLFIPLAAWLLVKEITTASIHTSFITSLVITCALAIIFTWACIRMRLLTLGGAIAASLIGVWVMYFAGAFWLIPLFVFLAGSTLFGRLNRTAATTDRKHGKPRDAIQVICNGGVFAAAASIPDPQLAQMAMGASIAVSAADTWASEIGMAFRGRTIDITTGRNVPSGLSGGISLAGSAGALFASLLFAVLAVVLMDRSGLQMLPFMIAGMGGMLVDSLFGSKLQPHFRCADGSLSDERRSGSKRISGFNWMSNDAVNIISNIIVTAAVVLLFDRALH